MAKPRIEDDKKHGDKLEPLIERAGGAPSPKRTATDDPGELQRDEEDIADDDEDDDADEDDDEEDADDDEADDDDVEDGDK